MCDACRLSMCHPDRARFTFLPSLRMEPFTRGAETRKANLDLATRKTGNARPWSRSWAVIASSRWPPEGATLFFSPVTFIFLIFLVFVLLFSLWSSQRVGKKVNSLYRLLIKGLNVDFNYHYTDLFMNSQTRFWQNFGNQPSVRWNCDSFNRENLLSNLSFGS